MKSEKGKLIEKNVAFRGCREGKTEVLPKGTNVQLQEKNSEELTHITVTIVNNTASCIWKLLR